MKKILFWGTTFLIFALSVLNTYWAFLDNGHYEFCKLNENYDIHWYTVRHPSGDLCNLTSEILFIALFFPIMWGLLILIFKVLKYLFKKIK